jgi:hypothetical protein
MRRALTLGLFCMLLAAGPWAGAWESAAAAPQGQVVDRIVARIEDDIITLSEMRELAAYQQLVDGQAEPDTRLMDELVDQWTINNEAQSAQFPQPSNADIDRQMQQIQMRFPTPGDFAQRLRTLGLTPESLRRIVTLQNYLTGYLDYRFRPAVQVDDDAIAKYYQETLAPALKAKQQPVPPLDAVTSQIREVLEQKGISERSGAWLDDTKSRLQIEIVPAEKPAASGKS